MEIILIPVLQIIVGLLKFYQLVIFVNIIFSWLFVFGIVDSYKHTILTNIFMFTRVLTEPLFNYVRRFVPLLGPIDLSPIIVILGIYISIGLLNGIIVKLSVVY